MKALGICSYLCSGLALICWALLSTEFLSHVRSIDDEDMFFLLFLIPPVLQLIYTVKTMPHLALPKFKDSNALDDFAMNDSAMNDEVVGNGFWLKSFSTINSIVLCIYFIAGTFIMKEVDDILDDRHMPGRMMWSILTFLSGYLFTVPTIIYNLRTFNLRRIRKSSL